MKHLMILLFAALTLMGCNDKKPSLDPYAKLALNALTSKSKVAPTPPYSMDTIVRYAYGSMFRKADGTVPGGPWGVPTRDLVKLKFWIGDAQSVVEVDKNGNAKLGFLVSGMSNWVVVAVHRDDKPTEWLDAYLYYEGKPIGLPNGVLDTIAYIPNALIRANEAAIKKAFDEQNYDLCLQLFENAYVFTPITGAEWRALKAKNEQ